MRARAACRVQMLLFMFAMAFLLICATSTTPLLKGLIVGDSPMFQTIGKYWARGVMPYTGLWDSKGPALFFINALGYWMTDSSLGVFIIQVISLFITEVFIYKLLCQAFSDRIALLMIPFILLFLNYTYDGGNFTEEYALPFLCASFYGVYIWSNTIYEGMVVHNPKWAFVYGCCFSFCALTRITNAIGLCVAILVICFVLVTNRCWSNLLYNSGAFIIGAIVMALPFVLYFGLHGQLDKMLYGTFLYNIEYAGSSSMKIDLMTVDGIIRYVGCYGLGIAGIIMMIRDRRNRVPGILWACVGTVTCIWFFKCYRFNHYVMITVPYVCIALAEFCNLRKKLQKKKPVRYVASAMMILIIAFSALGGAFRLKEEALSFYYQYVTIPNKNPLEPEYVAYELYYSIPEEERNSFVAYNCYSGLYLKLDVCPAYPYFTLQDWAMSRSTTLETRVMDTYANGNAKWILVMAEGEVGIQEILDKRYTCVRDEPVPYSEKERYKLYRLIET